MQTSIQTEGFRSLAEGEPVEYFLEAGDDGRTKAVQVTGPNGAAPQVSNTGIVYGLSASSSCAHMRRTEEVFFLRQPVPFLYGLP